MAPNHSVEADREDAHPTMMAWTVHEFGQPEVMRFERIARPVAGPSVFSDSDLKSTLGAGL